MSWELDLFGRVLAGARISLMVGLVGALVSLVIGVLWGATAGLLGGRWDNLMMRTVDVLYSLPSRSGGKTLYLRHELVRLGDEEPLVTGEVVAVLLDLATRRTVAMPSE